MVSVLPSLKNFLSKKNDKVADKILKQSTPIYKASNIEISAGATSIRPDIKPPSTIKLSEGPKNSIVPILPFPMKELYDYYYSCTELRAAIDKITETAFRNGFEIQPKFYFKCKECGNEIKYKPISEKYSNEETMIGTKDMTCDVCQEKGSMTLPEPKERRILSEWLNQDSWNENGETVEDIAKGFMFHYLVAENAYVVLERNYRFFENGSIKSRDIEEVSTVDSYLMFLIGNLSGRISYNNNNEKLYICPIHRKEILVQPFGSDIPPKCDMNDCNRESIPAIALALNFYQPHSGYILYGEGEIIRNNGFSVRTSGYSLSKIYTLYEKLNALIGLSRLMADRMYIQRPLNTLVFVKTDNVESLKANLKDLADKKAENRFASNVLAVPPTTTGNEKITEVVNIDDDLSDLHLNEMREAYARDIYDQYGVEPIECFTRDHEIMTENGFVPISIVKSGDKIATLTKEGKVIFETPTKLINQPYEGKMYEINSKFISLCVTKEHDLLVRNHIDSPYKKIKPPELPEEIDMKIDFPYKYGGKDIEYMTLGSGSNAKRYPAEPMLKLYTKYLVYGRIEGNALVFPKKSVLGIPNLFDKLNIPIDGKHDTIYSITNEHVVDMFNLSSIPPQILDCSATQLKPILNIILNGKINSDKHRIKHRVYDYELASNIQEMVLKCGYTCTLNSYIGTKVAYDLFISTREGTFDSKIIKKNNVKEIEYSGNVYCVTVPNGVIYVRRNGKCVWTGNSTPNVGSSATAKIGLSNSTIEYHQKFVTEKLLDQLVKAKGVNDWHIVPKKVEQRDSQREQQVLASKIKNIRDLRVAGFKASFDSASEVIHSMEPVENAKGKATYTNMDNIDNDGEPDRPIPSDNSGGSGEGTTSSGKNTSDDKRGDQETGQDI